MDATFIARMEQILHLYSLPVSERYPLVCFDERPCFVIGDTLLPRPMRKGEIAKQHYEYEKLGSASLLAAIEPLTTSHGHAARITKQATNATPITIQACRRRW